MTSFVNQVPHSSLTQSQCQEMADNFVKWYVIIFNLNFLKIFLMSCIELGINLVYFRHKMF